MPENNLFGGGAAETVLVPAVLVAMLIAIILILILPRRMIVVPFLTICLLVPMSQNVVLGGVHLFVARIVILFGIARLTVSRFNGNARVLAGGWNGIDMLFLAWVLWRALAFIARHGETGAVVNQCGFVWDTLGAYFFLRYAIHNEEDIHTTTKVLALITILVAVGMLLEQRSLTNMFSAIGGQTPAIRGGKIRSQGPFSHAILAGVFGATTMPLFFRLWLTHKGRFLAATGAIGATIMVLTSASSTPLGAYAAGIVGICAWPLRRSMRAIRLGMAAGIFVLALVMNAPVWFLIARLDFVGGSSGFHRAMLVDQAVRRFDEWWLIGARNNQDWGVGLDMWDVQNEFVAQALMGGLVALILFVLLVSRTFGRVGVARRRSAVAERRQEWLIWALGAVMFAHVVAFFGADYFDQTRFWWFSTLAMIIAATVPAIAKKSNRLQPIPAGLTDPLVVPVTVERQ